MKTTVIVEHTYMPLSVLTAQCVNPSEMVSLSQGIWGLTHLMEWVFQDKKPSYIEGNECDLTCVKSLSPISIEALLDVLMNLFHIGMLVWRWQS